MHSEWLLKMSKHCGLNAFAKTFAPSVASLLMLCCIPGFPALALCFHPAFLSRIADCMLYDAAYCSQLHGREKTRTVQNKNLARWMLQESGIQCRSSCMSKMEKSRPRSDYDAGGAATAVRAACYGSKPTDFETSIDIVKFNDWLKRFFYRASACYIQAERHIVLRLPIPSVRPSVCLIPVLWLNGWTYTVALFDTVST